MYILCASHIDSEERLMALCRSLDSVINARNPSEDTILMSISCVPNLQKHLESFVEQYKKDQIYILQQKEQLSQFQHYTELQKHLAKMPPSWCMFFDDDDYSHPTRFDMYRKHMQNKPDICSIYMAHAQKSICHPSAWRMTLEKLDEMGDISDGGQEYYMFAVTTDTLHYFCSNVGSDILAIPECDLLFRNYIRCLPCLLAYLNDCNTWLYAYTKTVTPVFKSIRVEYLTRTWRNIVIPRLLNVYHPLFDELKNTRPHYELLESQ